MGDIKCPLSQANQSFLGNMHDHFEVCRCHEQLYKRESKKTTSEGGGVKEWNCNESSGVELTEALEVTSKSVFESDKDRIDEWSLHSTSTIVTMGDLP